MKERQLCEDTVIYHVVIVNLTFACIVCGDCLCAVNRYERVLTPAVHGRRTPINGQACTRVCGGGDIDTVQT